MRHSATIIPLAPRRPKTFTAPEELIERVAALIMISGRTYRDLATECELSATTVQRLASRQTTWPRHTTLFPLLQALRVAITLTKI